jgi:histidyl-tRNA synthetase
MQGAPSVLDHLCPGCLDHFDAVQKALNTFDISFRVDHRLVRGLDYYIRTTFEVLTESLGAQDAVAGGGRYDGLVRALGGPDEPGVGFAVGADRLADLLADQAHQFERCPHLFIAAMGERAQKAGFQWLQELRLQGLRGEMDYENRSLKSQMRRANKLGASYALIVGDRELGDGTALLRNMETKNQEEVPLQDLVESVLKRTGTSGNGREQ